MVVVQQGLFQSQKFLLWGIEKDWIIEDQGLQQPVLSDEGLMRDVAHGSFTLVKTALMMKVGSWKLWLIIEEGRGRGKEYMGNRR